MRLFKNIFYLLFLSTALLCSCEPAQREKLIGEWYINPYHEEYQLEALNTHIILRLYTKGIFSQYGEFGFCSGTWKRNDKGSYIHLIRKAGNMPLLHEFLKIESFEQEKMTAGVFYKTPFNLEDREMIIQLTRRQNKSAEDPYKQELQAWRLKPSSSENEVDIRKRVVAYLHFLKSMYQHAKDNDVQTGNNWFPSPLRMDYGSAVRMAYENELATWNNCFYDSAQAVKGYQIISGPIQDITLKKSVSPQERNLDCVEQLLEKIEK